MKEIMRELEGSATNVAYINIDDEALTQLIDSCTENLKSMVKSCGLSYSPCILIIMPYARWERIEPFVDSSLIVHLADPLQAAIRGFSFGVTFIDRTLASEYKLPASDRLENVDRSIIAAMSTIRSCASQHTVIAPIGMRLYV